MESDNSRLIILASGSPRRRELLSLLGLPFEVISSDTDESTPPEFTPEMIVRSLALRKAEAVVPAAGKRNAVIVGSDTIVVLDDKVLGKPVDEQDSRVMLGLLQGKTHQVYTGVACIGLPEGKILVEHRVTSVTMRALSEEEISAYIATGEPADKAGSYAIQGLGATLVEKIEGCYFNVVGLPLSLLERMLSRVGISVLGRQG
ncbi:MULTISPECIES: Maf family protein [Paenibacillus]|uniref:dTTP/UTP pyrophosphatase n=1 Tax=Paenibacillus borealis TaxID=160799 RepID=A0ABX3GX87_PAEBO|nr:MULTISPECIES: Maf family protein [Paenibacillus]AIQ20087.1 septum formation protein Maf [Paenibacillus sp. FSL H7-0357]OMD38962.1 septum formation protein Maf [Paenibacillus borealis]